MDVKSASNSKFGSHPQWLQCGSHYNASIVCCPNKQVSSTDSSSDFSQCGKSERKENRIMGGKNATLGKPYFVCSGYPSLNYQAK